MNPLDSAAINWLDGSEHLVFKAGSEQEAQMANHLACKGWLCFPRHAIDLIEAFLRSRGRVVYANKAQARQEVLADARAEGWKWFAPAGQPVSGLIYEPQRGTSAPRAVFPSEELGRVAYRNMATGEDHSVTLATWDRWMAQARAKVAE